MVRMSARVKLTLARSVTAFSRATSSASAEMSMAVTRANFSARASEMAMHPLPVPKSATRKSVRDAYWSVIMSTSLSVSGRGISVAGDTRKRWP